MTKLHKNDSVDYVNYNNKDMNKIIKPLRSGQITIPADFREKLGIDANTLLQITLMDRELVIKPVKAVKTVGGSLWAKELYDIFAPVRTEAKEKNYDENKINTAISQALNSVRTKHAKSSI